MCCCFQLRNKTYAIPDKKRSNSSTLRCIVALRDEQSTGTKDNIDKAIALSKKVYIFEINTINI